MKGKYFFKSQSSIQRKFIAGGLSAVFGAGVYGSYAGAMNPGLNPIGVQDFTQFFNNLKTVNNQIRKIEYTNPEGQQGEVECRLKNGKIEIKMYGKDKVKKCR